MSYVIVEGKGEPLVFIHGLGNQKEIWEKQLELASKFQVIILDLVGHGSHPKEDVSMNRFVSDIINTLDKLNIQAAHFCGLSLGGLVAQRMNHLFPDRVLSLILSNTTPYIPLFFTQFMKKRQQKLIDDLGEEKFKQRAISACLHNPTNQEHWKLAEKGFNIRGNTYFKTITATIGFNSYFNLPLINKPTLLLGGEYDTITPIYLCLQMYAFIPRAKMKIFRNTGHLPNIENHKEYNQEIEKFLNN